MENSDIQPKDNKLKKYVKRFFICLGCFIWFVITLFLSLLLFATIFRMNMNLLDRWETIIIVTIISIVFMSFVLLLIKLIRSKGNKKIIKGFFVADCIIIFLMILCGLTKVGVIHNWLGIETLYPFVGDTSILEGYKCQDMGTNFYYCCTIFGSCINYGNFPSGIDNSTVVEWGWSPRN